MNINEIFCKKIQTGLIPIRKVVLDKSIRSMILINQSINKQKPQMIINYSI